MDKPLNFDVFRYFVEPLSGDLFEGKLSDVERRSLVAKYLLDSKDFSVRKSDFALVAHTVDESIVATRFARKGVVHYFERTASDIENRARENWPPIWVVCILAQQAIFIQRKSDFPDTYRIAELLTKAAERDFLAVGYILRVEPVVQKSYFWDLYDDAERVYSLSLQLHSPNFFGNTKAASEMLREINSTFNNTRSTVQLDNERGELKLPRKEIEPYTDYADSGGGNWKLRAKVTGQSKKTFRSRDKIRQVTVEIEGDLSEDEAIEVVKRFLSNEEV